MPSSAGLHDANEEESVFRESHGASSQAVRSSRSSTLLVRRDISESARTGGGRQSFVELVKERASSAVPLAEAVGNEMDLSMASCDGKQDKEDDGSDNTPPCAPEHSSQQIILDIAMQALVFVLFVSIAANENILKEVSKVETAPGKKGFGYSLSSAIAMASIFSVLLGLVICLARFESPLPCFYIVPLIKVLPVSVLLTSTNVMKFMALKYIPADAVLLLDQTQLLMLAVVSRAVLNRRYSLVQLLCLVVIFFGMVQYIGARDQQTKNAAKKTDDGQHMSSDLVIGASLMFGVSFCLTIVSVWVEYLVKGQPEPVHIQKTRIEIGGLLVSFCYCFLVAPFVLGDKKVYEPDGYFFNNWTGWTWAVVGICVARTWFATFVIKMLDAMVKQLGNCTALLLVYMELVLVDKNTHWEYNVVVSQFDVSLSIITFAVASRYSQQHRDMEAKLKKLDDEVQMVSMTA